MTTNDEIASELSELIYEDYGKFQVLNETGIIRTDEEIKELYNCKGEWEVVDANNGEPLVKLECITEDWGDMTNEVGTPIDENYKVGDMVFINHLIDGEVATTIGFLVYMVNKDDTILARTVSPLSDFITIPDDDFICLGHIKHLEGAN